MARVNQVVVVVGNVSRADELHQRLMTALDFPAFYGRNWDAFWDSITGLVEMPRILRLEGWLDLAVHLPRDAQLMKECLEKMQREDPEHAAKVEYA
jgi:RNAse (barnase) inhibitor barstar